MKGKAVKPKGVKQKRVRLDLTLSEVLEVLRDYNLRNGTMLSYGEFVSLIHSGKIKKKELVI